MVQILELFGGIGSPRCALRNLNIPTKAIDAVYIDEDGVIRTMHDAAECFQFIRKMEV